MNNQKDYLDKALDAAEKKFGGQAGANPDKYRNVNEKVVRPLSPFSPFPNHGEVMIEANECLA